MIPVVTVSFSLGSGLDYVKIISNHYTKDVYVSNDDFMVPDPVRMQSAVDNWTCLNYLYYVPYNMTGDGWDYYPFCDIRYNLNPRSYGIHNDSQLTNACDLFDKNDPFNEIKEYIETGHASAYAGQTLVGEALRYATQYRLGNIDKAEIIASQIMKIVKGINLFTEVSGDGSMVRFAVPDTIKARNYFKQFDSFIFNEQYSHTHIVYSRNYTAPNGKEYKFWCEGGTSVDLHAGVLLGLGVSYQFVNNLTIRSLIRQTVNKILDYFENLGWRFIDADGKTHLMGAEALNQMPFTDTSYLMAFLRVGKTVDSGKWSDLYDTYTHNRLMLRKVGKQVNTGLYDLFTWGGSYFNINLMLNLATILTLLEDDVPIRSYYRQNFLQPLYDMVHYHRNAWFDTAYALGMTDFDFSKEYDDYIRIPDSSIIKIDQNTWNYIEADVADCIMRCSYTKLTTRQFPNPNGLDSYNERSYLTKIPNAPYPDVSPFNWTAKINKNNPISKILSKLYNPTTGFNGYASWNNSIPADWRPLETFIWQRSCFDSRSIYLGEYLGAPPGGLTLPHSIGKFLNFSTLCA